MIGKMAGGVMVNVMVISLIEGSPNGIDKWQLKCIINIVNRE